MVTNLQSDLRACAVRVLATIVLVPCLFGDPAAAAAEPSKFNTTGTAVIAIVAPSSDAAKPATLRAVADKAIRIASWDLHDLWHQSGVPLRSGTTVRSTADFDVLRKKAKTLQADVVALQGIGSPRAARMLFPARDYFVIFSRELAIRQQRDRDILSNPARRRIYNAIAVRRAAKLRILAREQVLETADPSPALGAQRPQGQSALAVKLRINKRPVWIVTSRLLSGCADLDEATDLSKSERPSTEARKRTPACTAVRDQVLVLNAWKSRKVTKQEAVVLAVAVPQDTKSLARNSAIPKAWQTLTTSDPVKVTVAYNARKRADARRRSGASRYVLTNPIIGAATSASRPQRQPNTVPLTGPTRAPGQRLVKTSKRDGDSSTNFVVDALSDFAKAALGDKPKSSETRSSDPEPRSKVATKQQTSTQTLAELSKAGLAKFGSGDEAVKRKVPVQTAATSHGKRLHEGPVKRTRTSHFIRYPRAALSDDCTDGHVGSNFLLVDRGFHAATKGLRFGTALNSRVGGVVRASARTDCAIVLDIPRPSS